MKQFLLLTFIISNLLLITMIPNATGQCTDVPTTPEMGVYNTYRLDYDYRYYANLSDQHTAIYAFTMLQAWGCCDLYGACDIIISPEYGEDPTKDWENNEGVEAEFIFSAKGKYIVGANHPGFSNCSGGTSVRVLNFFLTDDLNDLDADGILNGVDANTDGDLLNNNVDTDDDNDDVPDSIDSTPGGYGTTPQTWPSDWGGSGPPSSGTPTPPVPTPTCTHTPTFTPTVSPVMDHILYAAKHPSSVFTQSKLDALEDSGYRDISRDDFTSTGPTPMPDFPTYSKIDTWGLFICPFFSRAMSMKIQIPKQS